VSEGEFGQQPFERRRAILSENATYFVYKGGSDVDEEERWTEDLSKILSEVPERLSRFSTISDMEIKGLYTPKDIENLDYSSRI
jgi:hypothetical protein